MRFKKRYKIKYRRNAFRKFPFYRIVILLSGIGFMAIFLAFDNRAFPFAVEIANIEVQNKFNLIVDEALTKIGNSFEFNSGDFYSNSEDSNGKIRSISANTILINSFCSKLAVELTVSMEKNPVIKVEVPTGAIIGVNLGNLAPKYKTSIILSDNVSVDYDTEFSTGGINQINYQIWLTIKTKTRIANYLQSKVINIERKVLLINTVITSDLPPSIISNAN